MDDLDVVTGDVTSGAVRLAVGGGTAAVPGQHPGPNGDPVIFEADFPPPMGGTGSAPNPLAYCFWGGLACYAMTYAQEAARQGIELRAVRARTEAEVDQSRALGVTRTRRSIRSTGTSRSTPTPRARSSKSSSSSPTITVLVSGAYRTPSTCAPISTEQTSAHDHDGTVG